MGLKDLKTADDFNRITQEIANEPGLNQAQRDAVLATLSQATAHITDATAKARAGLKVANFVTAALKNPLGILATLGLG